MHTDRDSNKLHVKFIMIPFRGDNDACKWWHHYVYVGWHCSGDWDIFLNLQIGMSISWEQKFPHLNPIKPDKGFSEVK